MDAPFLLHRDERIRAPAGAGPHDVDVAVEMHARPGRRALVAGDDIDARVALVVAWRSGGMQVFDLEPPCLQAAAYEFGAGAIRLAGRVHGGEAYECAREIDELVAPRLDPSDQPARAVALHGAMIPKSRRGHALAPVRAATMSSHSPTDPDGRAKHHFADDGGASPANTDKICVHPCQ